MITIYTDGSSRSSTQSGGFGVVAFNDKNEIIYLYQEQHEKVTNNQMELRAIIHACEWADKVLPQEEIIIYSDSTYCVNSINVWMWNWSKNGWINSKKQQVENIDLMKTLYKYFTKDFYHCQVQWLKGHAGFVPNEIADALATHDANKFAKIISNEDITINLINKI